MENVRNYGIGDSVKKRKPLSDLSNNVNFIHNETHRKLRSLAPSSSPSQLAKGTITDPTPDSIPIPTPKSKSIPNSKPYSSATRRRQSCATAATSSSKSNTSIGSSSVTHNNNGISQENPSSSDKQFHPSTPPISGSENDDIFEPLVVYSRKKSVEKARSNGDAVTMLFTSSSVDSKKDRARARDVRFSARVEEFKSKGNTASMSFNSVPLEKRKDKGKTIVGPSISHLEKSKDREIVVPLPLNLLVSEKRNNKGKAIAMSFSSHHHENKKGIKKSVSVPLSSSPKKSQDKGKITDFSIDILSLKKTKEKGNMASIASSCPPRPRTKSTRKEVSEVGEMELSYSLTDPRSKQKKKRRCKSPESNDSEYAWPRDFIERQKAYFKEVDEFELPVEEESDEE